MGIDIIDEQIEVMSPSSLRLRHTSALIGAMGYLDVTVALSFDESLMLEFVRRFVYGGVKEDDTHGMAEDVASEIINIILGNATKSFPKIEDGFVMTPPVIVSQASKLSCKKESIVWIKTLKTKFGDCSIFYVCKKELFDEELNYKMPEQSKGE